MMDPHEDILEWSAHPLREQPARAVVVCVVILACGLLVSLAVGDPTGGVLAGGAAMLFLLFMLNRFFLPVPTGWMPTASRSAIPSAAAACAGSIFVDSRMTRWEATCRRASEAGCSIPVESACSSPAGVKRSFQGSNRP